MTGLWLLAACTHSQPSRCCDTLGDTAADTADTGPIDTSDTSDTADTSQPDDSDTYDTSSVPLPGSFTLSGTWNSVEVTLSCDEGTDTSLFTRYWGSSLGNVSGGFSCADEAGQRVTVSYISPSEGEWPDTSDGKSWIVEDGNGSVLAWGVADTAAWDLTFTTYTFVDATTVRIEGTLAGTWTTAGVPFAELTGTFDLQVPCTSGC